MAASMPVGQRRLDWPEVAPEHHHQMQRTGAWYGASSAFGQTARPETSFYGNNSRCTPASSLPALAPLSTPETWASRNNAVSEPRPPTRQCPSIAGIPAVAGPTAPLAENAGGLCNEPWYDGPADIQVYSPPGRSHPNQPASWMPVAQQNTVNPIAGRFEHRNGSHRVNTTNKSFSRPDSRAPRPPGAPFPASNSFDSSHTLPNPAHDANLDRTQQTDPDGSETAGERRARQQFATDFASAPIRIPTPFKGCLCAWAALVRSWCQLRFDIADKTGHLLEEITTAEVGEAFLRICRHNLEFDVGNTNTFRVDQMGAAITGLILERFNIRVQMGFVFPHRGKEYFPVLVPWNDDLGDPEFRLWVYNNNVEAEDWAAAHFEGLSPSTR